MKWLNELIRADLRDFVPYHSARDEAGDFTPSISLDANEFPWPPFGLGGQCNANRYPEPQPTALLSRLAALWDVKAEQILLGRGSDEGIDVIVRLLCAAGRDNILVCPPTYGIYEVAAKVQGAGVVIVPLKCDGQLDMGAIKAACTPETKLIFIPSPNVPMGHMMRRDDLLELCKTRLSTSLIVIDEAYIEFTDTPEGMLPELKDQSNLVVLRTLSKAHALAGERIGAVIADCEIIVHLRKIQAPYPLTQTGIRAALDTLSPNGLVQSADRRRLLVQERERISALLTQSTQVIKVFPSIANFLLVQTKDSAAFMKQMRQFGILPRDRHRDIPNTVRLSVGTPEENNLVLQALGITVKENGALLTPRLFSTRHKTDSTAIDVTVNLDKPGFLKVDTGIGFFDHMLAQIATHGGFGLEMHCKGDLECDQHHTIEDCALALGETLKIALGDKRGVARYGFTAPLDESVAQVLIDLSGRPYCTFKGTLPAKAIGDFDREMVAHFFHSLSNAMSCAIHIDVRGDNTHHIVEATFKAVGRAFRQAFKREGDQLPSTKGML
jgi:histidinol-phosphate aminotransferase